MLIPILCALLIAVMIAVILKLLQRPQMNSLRNTLARLAGLSESEAFERVSRLIDSQTLRVRRVDSLGDVAANSLQGGVATKDFAGKFSEIEGDGFKFFAPNEVKRIGGREYLVVGTANDGQTTYLVKRDTDTVLVFDLEDRDVDSQLSLPSIWHALLFEAGAI